MLRFTPIAPVHPPDPLHEAMRQADEAWRGAMAYDLGDDVVRPLVQEFITASYAYQKAKYGRIRVKLSTASILRGGWK